MEAQGTRASPSERAQVPNGESARAHAAFATAHALASATTHRARMARVGAPLGAHPAGRQPERRVCPRSTGEHFKPDHCRASRAQRKRALHTEQRRLPHL